VVCEPPDVDGLADQLQGTQFARVDREPEVLEDLGRIAGRQLVDGGPLADQIREQLLNRSSGHAAQLDGVIVVRDAPTGLDESEKTSLNRLEAGLLDGIRDAGQAVVGVEQSDTEPSSIHLFDSHEISTSDSIDLVSGRVAAVFVLLGADGNFGTKETADQLLPDLLVPTAPSR
jgi:hypothetical protein